MKLDFKKQVLQLDGSAYLENDSEPVMLNKVIANNLANMTKGDYLKHFEMARKIYNEGMIDLEQADTNYLKKLVESLELSAIVKFQAMQVFEIKSE